MKDEGTPKNSEKSVTEINAQKSEKELPEKETDSLAANDKDTTKVRAVDGNASA